MALIGDQVYDHGLDALDTDANRLDICSQEPANYTEAMTTYTLGNKVPPTIGAPADAAGGGREVDVSAITDGSVTGTGDASHWAITDTINSRLLAAGPLASTQGVTSGNTFTLTTFKVTLPDPA